MPNNLSKKEKERATLEVFDTIGGNFYEVDGACYDNPETNDYQNLEQMSHYLPEHGRVLDMGCGPGGASKLLQKLGYRPIAMDYSFNMVRSAVSNILEQTGIRPLAARADTRAIPLMSDSMDGIVSSYILHLFEDEKDIDKALSELYRVLKPGGIGYISTAAIMEDKIHDHVWIKKDEKGNEILYNAVSHYYHPFDTWKEHIKKAGFEIIEKNKQNQEITRFVRNKTMRFNGKHWELGYFFIRKKELPPNNFDSPK